MEIFSTEIKALTDKCDDIENRLRRSNLIFFGIKDADGEAWAESETRLISFSSEKLGITVNRDDIERAQGLGRFQPEKNRPIIVKLERSSRILSAGPKLKDSSYAIREDYSTRVRTARKILFTDAQERSTNFKIRFDRLLMNDRKFTYNIKTNSVEEVEL